ncbi:mucin-5AC-like [Hippocampus comes]|uniref:mucin-5AC-like n=1 Tax=Hippocampus comes TaxID=109280 RepID=UPI00094E6D6D|nr:PREDICTED: mucin-5AC-like [Hippocampus comes]
MSGPSGRIEAWLLVTLVTLVHLDIAEGTGGDARPSRRNPARFFPVPVWKFMAVSGREGSFDLTRPQFRCSDDRLWVRLSLVRHSKARLANGIRLLALPDSSADSVRRFGPVLLLKLPYGSAHLQLAVANGRRFHQLQIFYFDSLLQTNMVALASCEDLANDLHLPPPLMLCKPSQILVQLPLGSKVLKIKNIGDGAPIRPAVSMVEAGSVFVLNSTAAHTYSMVVYLDSLGEMSTMLAACDNADTQRPHKVQPRSLRDEVDSDSQAATEELECTTTTTAAPISVFYRDSPIFELWGYDEIPSGEYNEDDTADTTGDLAPTRSSTMSATTLRPCDTTTSPSPAPACASLTDATTPKPRPDAIPQSRRGTTPALPAISVTTAAAPTSSVSPTAKKISALTPSTPGSRTSAAAPLCATMTPPAMPRATTSSAPTTTSAVPSGVFRFDAPWSMSAAMLTTSSSPTTTTPTAPVTTPSSASSSTFVSITTEPATAGASTELYTSEMPTMTSSAPTSGVPATPSTSVVVTAVESRRTTALLAPTTTTRPTLVCPILPITPPTSPSTSSAPTSNSSLTPTSTGTTTAAASSELSDSMMPTITSPATTMTPSGSRSTILKVSRTLSISKSPELGTTTFTMATTSGVPTTTPASSTATRPTTTSSVPTTSSASLMTYWTMTAVPTTTSSLPSMTTLVPTTNMFPLTSAKTSIVVPATTQANVSVSSTTSLKRVASQSLPQTIPMSAPTIRDPLFTTTDPLTTSTAVLPGSGAPVRNITLALATIPTPPSSLMMATASAPTTSPVLNQKQSQVIP